MREELEDKLFKIAPILYKQKDLNIYQSCLAFGIECPDEWFDLLQELSVELEKINNNNNGIEIQAAQVKYKYGSLRFYYDIITELPYKKIEDIINKVDTIIYNAEIKSKGIK